MIGKNSTEEGGEEPGKLFVGGLSWETTEEKLTNYFNTFGEVLDSVVMKNTESGQSRGFGFVTFADPESVHAVIQKGPHILDGRAIDPKPCNTKSAMKSKRNSQYPKVFLGGLPYNVTETDLRSLFSRFGNVMDVIIMYDNEKNKCRGFGFLSFEDQESVTKCVNEHFVYVNGKKVEIKREEPRNNSGSGGNQWNTVPNGGSGDPAAMMGAIPGYAWGATPTAAYGYGAPGAAYPGGWGPPPQAAWGGYPAQPYGPYGAPPVGPYAANWNWNMAPNGPLVPPTGAPAAAAAPRITDATSTDSSFSGPQRSNATSSSHSGYHPYRRV